MVSTTSPLLEQEVVRGYVTLYNYGKGSVLKIQARLSTDFEYLIIVGHRGTSVCAVPENANHPVCQQPRPMTFQETIACDEFWYTIIL